MKKIIAALFLLFSCSSAHAGIITFDQATTDNSITRAWLNNTFYSAYNTINGNISTENLATGAVASDDIATAANPLVRDTELIGEMVYTGITIAVPAPASLTGTIAAGTAYVENDGDNTLHRVVKAATNKTFTATKDTWVYLDYAGAYSYTEQAVGAAQPTTPDNSMVIAKVVTNASGITSVTDYRQTSPTNLRVYTYYKNGVVVSRDTATATTVNVNAGELELGSDNGGVRKNTTSVNIDFTAVGRNGIDAGALAQGYYYIHAIKDDATSTNFDVIASLSSTDVTGFTGERLIGWCYAPSGSAISPDSIGAYRGTGGDAPNCVMRYISSDISTTSTSYVDVSGVETRFYSSGRPVVITFSAPIYNTGNSNTYVVFDVDGTDYGSLKTGSAAASLYDQTCLRWKLTLSQGEHIIKPQWRVDGNTGQINGTSAGPAVLTVEEL